MKLYAKRYFLAVHFSTHISQKITCLCHISFTYHRNKKKIMSKFKRPSDAGPCRCDRRERIREILKVVFRDLPTFWQKSSYIQYLCKCKFIFVKFIKLAVWHFSVVLKTLLFIYYFLKIKFKYFFTSKHWFGFKAIFSFFF